jgi:hypothetical protein
MDGEAGAQAAGVRPEQRKHERRGFKVNRLIRATLDFGDGNPREQYLYLVDISEGGLRVNIDQELEQPFRIAFTLQYLDLDVTVRPIWQKTLVGGTSTVGLAFHDPTPEQLEQVRAMVGSFSVEGRRERFRLKALISVALREDEGEWFNILLVDISPKGLRGVWDDALDADRDLNVRILPPNIGEVEARAKVAWQEQIGPRRFEFGLEFTAISEENAQRIQRFIDATVGAA